MSQKIDYDEFAAKVRKWSEERLAVWWDGVDRPVTDPGRLSKLDYAVNAWRDLAKAEVKYANSVDEHTQETAMRRAFTYESAAISMEIERRTSVAICTCHHFPFIDNMKWVAENQQLGEYGVGGKNL